MTAPAKPTPTREEAEAALYRIGFAVREIRAPEHWDQEATLRANNRRDDLATIRAALALLPTQEEVEAWQRAYDENEPCEASELLFLYLDRLRGTVQP